MSLGSSTMVILPLSITISRAEGFHSRRPTTLATWLVSGSADPPVPTNRRSAEHTQVEPVDLDLARFQLPGQELEHAHVDLGEPRLEPGVGRRAGGPDSRGREDKHRRTPRASTPPGGSADRSRPERAATIRARGPFGGCDRQYNRPEQRGIGRKASGTSLRRRTRRAHGTILLIFRGHRAGSTDFRSNSQLQVLTCETRPTTPFARPRGDGPYRNRRNPGNGKLSSA